MAIVSVRGTQECANAFKALQFKFKEQALRKAARAGAEIAKKAIEAAAPVGAYPKGRKNEAGPIRSNIIIYTRKRTAEDKGEYISMLAGPSRKAYYSFFQEEGWIPAGPRITWYAAKGRWLPEWKSGRRRLRIAGEQRGHSQMGSISKAKPVQGKHWAAKAYSACSGQILDAMTAVFRKVVGQ